MLQKEVNTLFVGDKLYNPKTNDIYTLQTIVCQVYDGAELISTINRCLAYEIIKSIPYKQKFPFFYLEGSKGRVIVNLKALKKDYYKIY